ncbi:hypothetical protein ScPMuIL_007201 [Solemya velum]
MLFVALPSSCGERVESYCLPGSSCWPSTQSVAVFGDSLDGQLVLPDNIRYASLVSMVDTRTTRYPAMVVLVGSVSDVQKAVRFARSFDLKISIRSSGHDFIGRSTGDGTLQINLSNMANISVNTASSSWPAGEVTVESGNSWIRVYEEVDKHNRVMIGGSAHTVAMGGYTLGGGHSPISRTFGLAVDNLLGVEMVAVNGTLVRASANGTTYIDDDGGETHDSNADLFWALRGGGGGTFGVVTKFTFKLHMPPDGMVRLVVIYPFMYLNGAIAADDVLRFYENFVKTLPPQWGGYAVISMGSVTESYYGTILFAMNHFGSWNSPSRAAADTLYNFRRDLQLYRNYTTFRTFLEYEKNRG